MQEANITSCGVMTQLELIVPQSQKTDVIQRAGHEDILLPFSGEIQLQNSWCLYAHRGLKKKENICQLWCHGLCKFIKIPHVK